MEDARNALKKYEGGCGNEGEEWSPQLHTQSWSDVNRAEKQAELAIVLEKVRVIVERVNALKAQLQEAVDKKQAVEDDANKLQLNLSLANRLVNGLADDERLHPLQVLA